VKSKSPSPQTFEQQFAFVAHEAPTFEQTTGWQMLSPQVLEQQLPLFWHVPPRFVQGMARQMPSPQIPEQQSLLAVQLRPNSVHDDDPGIQTLFWQLPVQH